MSFIRHAQRQAGLIVLALSLLLSASSSAQLGTIAGTITEANGSPVPFLNVSVLGTSKGAATDLDGNYNFNVEAGTYSILLSYVGFKNDTLRSVEVDLDETTRLDHVMGSNAIDIAAFEIAVVRDRERESVLLMDRKESSLLVQNIGAVELQRKGASDAAEGVKKVVGLSVLDGRYLTVRGLGDRYNSAYLNGIPLPSPDPDAKVTPLDIFPTSVVRNISVNKAFSPELYGDFAGGAVDIRTKTALEESLLKISFGGAMNSISTFKNGKTYSGGGSDFWGFDDGTRDLPAGLNSTDPSNGELVLPFRSNLNSMNKVVMPDLNFGLLAGSGSDIGKHSRLNFLFTANYKNESRYRIGKNRIVNKQNVELIDYTVESYDRNTQSSALGSVNLQLGKRHGITLNLLFVNLSSDQHRENYGTHFDYEDEVYARRYTCRQNSVWVNQILGQHELVKNDRLRVKWNVSCSKANSDEPDRRQLVYLYDKENDTYHFNAIDRVENHRWYSELEEDELSFGGSLEYRIKEKKVNERFVSLLALELGAQGKRKDRSFDYRIFAYRLEGLAGSEPGGVNVNTPDAYLDQSSYQSGMFFIQDVTGIESKHFIRQDINALYGSLKFDLIPEKLHVLVGGRVEDGGQRVIYRNNYDSEIDPYRVATNSSVELLPYLNLKYDMNEVNVLRLSLSETMSRPGFREMAPFEYTEYFAGSKNVGNPDLRNGTNYNADLRFERFASSGELAAVGVFAKILDDPIEKVALASASGQLQSFRNTGRANLLGLELEYLKNLGKLLGKDSSAWSKFTFGSNATFLYSNIDLSDNVGSDGASQTGTNIERSLQGASPYLINADLSFKERFTEKFEGVVTLAYNVYGRRLYAAGENGSGDQFELSMNTLDLIIRTELGEQWSFSLKGNNLLNAEYLVEQETPEGTAIINSYHTGVGVGFGVSYRIF